MQGRVRREHACKEHPATDVRVSARGDEAVVKGEMSVHGALSPEVFLRERQRIHARAFEVCEALQKGCKSLRNPIRTRFDQDRPGARARES